MHAVYEAGAVHTPILLDIVNSAKVCEQEISYDFRREFFNDPASNPLNPVVSQYTHKFDMSDMSEKRARQINRLFEMLPTAPRHKRQIVAVTLGVIAGGAMLWNAISAHDAKKLAESNRNNLDELGVALGELENNIDAKFVLIQKQLYAASKALAAADCVNMATTFKYLVDIKASIMFDQIMDTLETGRLHTSILPLKSIKSYLDHFPALAGSIYYDRPHLLYALATVGVITDDLKSSNIMRGSIRVPQLLSTFENVTMQFMITHDAIFGPMYVGQSSNRSMETCVVAKANHQLFVCSANNIPMHNATLIKPPVSMYNGLVVVNHGVEVLIEPGNESGHPIPYRAVGPLILDILTARQVTYKETKWFIEPSAFEVKQWKFDWNSSQPIFPHMEFVNHSESITAWLHKMRVQSAGTSMSDYVSDFFDGWGLWTWFEVICLVLLGLMMLQLWCSFKSSVNRNGGRGSNNSSTQPMVVFNSNEPRAVIVPSAPSGKSQSPPPAYDLARSL